MSPRVKPVEVWTDAAVYSSTGIVVIAWVIRVDGVMVESRAVYDTGGAASSALAELSALRAGLRRALDLGHAKSAVTAITDNQGAIGALNAVRARLNGWPATSFKSARGKQERKRHEETAASVLVVAEKFQQLVFRWVPREQNHVADWLTRCYGKRANRRVKRSGVFADAVAALEKIAAAVKTNEEWAAGKNEG